ncbi:hypothetical protein K493DRAFT_314597, partial [Basidiobolus meristosporus CBS 931.73]
MSPTKAIDAPSILINLATVPKAFPRGQVEAVEAALVKSRPARETTWSYSHRHTLDDPIFDRTRIEREPQVKTEPEHQHKPQFGLDNSSHTPRPSASPKSTKLEKRAASEEPSGYTPAAKKPFRSQENNLQLPEDSTLDKPLSDCSDIEQLPLPAGFGEVELEAIRILGSFSQPRDTSGPSHLDGNSSINSSRATSVEYTPPHQQQQQQHQHQQQQSLQPHPALPLPLVLPQLQLHPHQHQHPHHVGSPLL